MKKYEQLQKDYSQEIAEIKALQAEEAALRDSINKWERTNDPDAVMDSALGGGELSQLYDRFAEVGHDIAVAYTGLRREIDIEYNDVPYSASALQGAKRFFSLAGL